MPRPVVLLHISRFPSQWRIRDDLRKSSNQTVLQPPRRYNLLHLSNPEVLHLNPSQLKSGSSIPRRILMIISLRGKKARTEGPRCGERLLEGEERAFEPGKKRLTRTFTPSETDGRPTECGLYLTCKANYSTLVTRLSCSQLISR